MVFMFFRSTQGGWGGQIPNEGIECPFHSKSSVPIIQGCFKSSPDASRAFGFESLPMNRIGVLNNEFVSIFHFNLEIESGCSFSRRGCQGSEFEFQENGSRPRGGRAFQVELRLAGTIRVGITNRDERAVAAPRKHHPLIHTTERNFGKQQGGRSIFCSQLQSK